MRSLARKKRVHDDAEYRESLPAEIEPVLDLKELHSLEDILTSPLVAEIGAMCNQLEVSEQHQFLAMSNDGYEAERTLINLINQISARLEPTILALVDGTIEYFFRAYPTRAIYPYLPPEEIAQCSTDELFQKSFYGFFQGLYNQMTPFVAKGISFNNSLIKFFKKFLVKKIVASIVINLRNSNELLRLQRFQSATKNIYISSKNIKNEQDSRWVSDNIGSQYHQLRKINTLFSESMSGLYRRFNPEIEQNHDKVIIENKGLVNEIIHESNFKTIEDSVILEARPYRVAIKPRRHLNYRQSFNASIHSIGDPLEQESVYVHLENSAAAINVGHMSNVSLAELINPDIAADLENKILKAVALYLKSKPDNFTDLLAAPGFQRIIFKERLGQQMEAVEYHKDVKPEDQAPSQEAKKERVKKERLPTRYTIEDICRSIHTSCPIKCKAFLRILRRILGPEERVRGSHHTFRSPKNNLTRPFTFHADQDIESRPALEMLATWDILREFACEFFNDKDYLIDSAEETPNQ